MIAVLRGSADLAGASCAGDSRFTSDAESDIAVAVTVCGSCPVIDTCRSWVDSLPPSRRPSGVVAGMVFADGHAEVAESQVAGS